MTNKLFVRGLAYSIDDNQLAAHFAQAGTVQTANVIIDRMNNQSKGFGFVEMSSQEEAKNAIKQFDGTELEGRTIYVQEAKPQENRPQGGGGSSRGGWDSRGGDRNSRGGNNRSNRY